MRQPGCRFTDPRAGAALNRPPVPTNRSAYTNAANTTFGFPNSKKIKDGMTDRLKAGSEK